MCNKYNGWNNYETWNIALWIDNEEESQELFHNLAQEIYDDNDGDEDETKYELSKRIKDWVEENNPIDEASLYSDLLQSTIDNADYYEIAENMIEGVEKIENISCDQCGACMIQGVFCHEGGCPNEKKTWNKEEEIWEDDEVDFEDDDLFGIDLEEEIEEE